MAITTNDLKNGMTLDLDDGLFQVVEFQHVKPGKGGAFVRTTLKNVRTGAVVDRTFRAGEKVEQAIIDKREMQYLYHDGDDYVFMDNSHLRPAAGRPTVARRRPPSYLIDGSTAPSSRCTATRSSASTCPASVELTVTETEPGIQGDRVSGARKPATLETGLVVQVPLFVNPGEKLKVDTRTGEYMTPCLTGPSRSATTPRSSWSRSSTPTTPTPTTASSAASAAAAARERALALLYEADAKGRAGDRRSSTPCPSRPTPTPTRSCVASRASATTSTAPSRASHGLDARADAARSTGGPAHRQSTSWRTAPTCPSAVVINEAVELAKQYSTDDSGRFVNGILASSPPPDSGPDRRIGRGSVAVLPWLL